MRTLALAAAILAGVAGCASYDRIGMTRVEPAGPGVWRFVAGANATYPLDSPRAEDIRLGWLDEAMRRNCPTGYDIASRQPAFRFRTLGVDVYEVNYDVRCRAEASAG